jgi:hypothetical protein
MHNLHNLPNVLPVVVWHGALHCMKLDSVRVVALQPVCLAVASRLAERLVLCLQIFNLSGQKGRREGFLHSTLSVHCSGCMCVCSSMQGLLWD